MTLTSTLCFSYFKQKYNPFISLYKYHHKKDKRSFHIKKLKRILDGGAILLSCFPDYAGESCKRVRDCCQIICFYDKPTGYSLPNKILIFMNRFILQNNKTLCNAQGNKYKIQRIPCILSVSKIGSW